jgi:hypothetical protein
MNASSITGGRFDLGFLHWSHYLYQLCVTHVLSVAFLALAADYAWMLYMRWRMVRQPSAISHARTDSSLAARTPTMADMWQHFQPSRQQALVLL